MKNLSQPQIVGSMSATLSILESHLKAIIQVHGEQIPAQAIKEVLEYVQKQYQAHEDQWNSRAS
jgi:hypothetical protein